MNKLRKAFVEAVLGIFFVCVLLGLVFGGTALLFLALEFTYNSFGVVAAVASIFAFMITATTALNYFMGD